jgi:hypothetical protein
MRVTPGHQSAFYEGKRLLSPSYTQYHSHR